MMMMMMMMMMMFSFDDDVAGIVFCLSMMEVVVAILNFVRKRYD